MKIENSIESTPEKQHLNETPAVAPATPAKSRTPRFAIQIKTNIKAGGQGWNHNEAQAVLPPAPAPSRLPRR